MTYERLRLAREAKGWTIDEASRRAGIRPRTIELIDRGEFGELPPGLYGRAAIRNYANAVGLNGAEMVEALRLYLQSEGDPLDALARRCGHTLKAEARTPQNDVRPSMSTAAVMDRPVATPVRKAVVAVESAPVTPEPAIAEPYVEAPAIAETPVLFEAPAAVERSPVIAPVMSPVLAFDAPIDEPAGVRTSMPSAELPGALEESVFTPTPPAPREMEFDLRYEVVAASEPDLHVVTSHEADDQPWDDPVVTTPVAAAAAQAAPRPEAGREWWRPAGALAIDGAVLVGIGSGLVWLTAIVGATSVPVVLRAATPGIALVFALIVSLYFVLFGGVGNGTPGGMLMRLEQKPSGRTILNAREVFGRAARAVYRDSLVVD